MQHIKKNMVPGGREHCDTKQMTELLWALVSSSVLINVLMSEVLFVHWYKYSLTFVIYLNVIC